MTQIRLSYEEQILNALSRCGGYKKKPKPETYIEYAERRFQAIRDVLKPLYDQVKVLENEQKIGVKRIMAVQYAGRLRERLEAFREMEKKEDPSEKTSIYHLKKMCKQIVEHTGYVPDEWSITKLHRWIGYIQGVMTAKGLTTVDQERNDYKTMKEAVLAELNANNAK